MNATHIPQMIGRAVSDFIRRSACIPSYAEPNVLTDCNSGRRTFYIRLLIVAFLLGQQARATDTVWIDDALPAGATTLGNETWNWVSSNPSPVSGWLSHQSTLIAGLHEHAFNYAATTFAVNVGDVMHSYVYVDAANPPSEIMLSWCDDSGSGTAWEHRAYWGQNLIAYGNNNSPGRRYMGTIPAGWGGQWIRLEVPASLVDLEGRAVAGMSFSLYDGRATWDASGIRADTNYTGLKLPRPGDFTLNILSPTLLELKRINTKNPDPARVDCWDFFNANNQYVAPVSSEFTVTTGGIGNPVAAVGFRRRPLYASESLRDLSIENSLYLSLTAPIADNQTVEVTSNRLESNRPYTAIADPFRYSPAIHVNQEGYLPARAKKAMVGYYLGSLGEMNVPTNGGFQIVEASSGAVAFNGLLVARPDVGYDAPQPYQQVWEADFSSFTTPGKYRLVVPGLGASLPFIIDDRVAMDFLRTYALGLYQQRCGTSLAMPFTRFIHNACHTAPAAVPVPESSFTTTWSMIAQAAAEPGWANDASHPRTIGPTITNRASLLYDYANPALPDGNIGGHHDAGDYSKYTINCAKLVHFLMFTVDCVPGAAALDNLGIPESGDGISDVMQEAKWEADYIAKLQDADGGFYFLAYQRNRAYEIDVLPDHGDLQAVWPKNTAATAAAVAALAQCASSPLFKRTYPDVAASYLTKAQLGWQFLTNAINAHGKDGAYQKLTHYGDNFIHDDELAWAACEMFVATGPVSGQQYYQKLHEWFPDPSDPNTRMWGWWRLSECYGNAIRSFAFAEISGRLPQGTLASLATAPGFDSNFLPRCQAEIIGAGDDVLQRSRNSAYGTAFPTETKHIRAGGWYFSLDQAADLVAAYLLQTDNPTKQNYLDAIVANMNYEGGTNPINVTYVTGLGRKRQREIVHQYAKNDDRVLPPSGIPLGNIQTAYEQLPFYTSSYGNELNNVTFPAHDDPAAPYPPYDRWTDTWNASTEFVVWNQARSMMALSLLASQTTAASQTWTSGSASIAGVGAADTIPLYEPTKFTFQSTDVDPSAARIVWDGLGQEPGFGPSYDYTPAEPGQQWIEVEAVPPDGRRVVQQKLFNADGPTYYWVTSAIPKDGQAYSGGEGWQWITSDPPPETRAGKIAHDSPNAAGEHSHTFAGATRVLTVKTGDKLFIYIKRDPTQMPSEAMVCWNDGSSWEHRAYWGANNITSYGSDGTPSRYRVGNLPPAGQWVQLVVNASDVGLAGGSVVTGLSCLLYDGHATWSSAGRTAN